MPEVKSDTIIASYASQVRFAIDTMNSSELAKGGHDKAKRNEKMDKDLVAHFTIIKHKGNSR